MKFTSLQLKLLTIMHQYRDLLYVNRTMENAQEIRDIYALHILNHIYQTRDVVIRNNVTLAQAQENNEQAPELRDQGFTRPKVLLVLPTRSAVVRFMDRLIKISHCEGVVSMNL
jgi:U3 small nucleolar RNA-associated protein 25